jgi:hypothetical protein
MTFEVKLFYTWRSWRQNWSRVKKQMDIFWGNFLRFQEHRWEWNIFSCTFDIVLLNVSSHEIFYRSLALARFCYHNLWMHLEEDVFKSLISYLEELKWEKPPVYKHFQTVIHWIVNTLAFCVWWAMNRTSLENTVIIERNNRFWKSFR